MFQEESQGGTATKELYEIGLGNRTNLKDRDNRRIISEERLLGGIKEKKKEPEDLSVLKN